jgi:aspartate/methionine/tyrosine aminotransferase
MEMVREAAALEAAGRSIVRFDVGQPFEGPSAAVLSAAAAAGGAGYTEALGSPALRAALSDWYAQTYGVMVPAARIAIATGASGAFLLAFLALFATGDRVAMAAPGYPPYRHILTSLGMVPASVAAGPESGLQLDPAGLVALEREGPIAGALVASPANPTGAMLPREALTALAQACRARGIPLISDEIYHGLVYGPRAVSALEVDPDAVVINSFSKYWAMTGWRVGWLVAPESLMGAVERLAQNLFICPPAAAQAGALAALSDIAPCEARRALYAQSRALLLEALPGLRLTPVAAPDGAFYVLADVSAHAADSTDFCRHALHEAGVSMTPGIDFDEARGARWVRIAYARRPEEVRIGLERLAAWLPAR